MKEREPANLPANSPVYVCACMCVCVMYISILHYTIMLASGQNKTVHVENEHWPEQQSRESLQVK